MEAMNLLQWGSPKTSENRMHLFFAPKMAMFIWNMMIIQWLSDGIWCTIIFGAQVFFRRLKGHKRSHLNQHVSSRADRVYSGVS